MAPLAALGMVPLLSYVAGGGLCHTGGNVIIACGRGEVQLGDNNFAVASMRGRPMEGSVGQQLEE